MIPKEVYGIDFDNYVKASAEETLLKIEAVVEAIKNYKPLDNFVIEVPESVFRKCMQGMKRNLKRAWREQRSTCTTSKSEWMASKGLRKEWQ